MWSYEKKIYNENHLIKLWLRNWDVILCAELVLRLEANTAKTQPNQLVHVNPTFCHSPTVEFLFNGHESLPGTIWVSPRNAQSKCQFNNVAWIRLETTLWDHHFFRNIRVRFGQRGPRTGLQNLCDPSGSVEYQTRWHGCRIRWPWANWPANGMPDGGLYTKKMFQWLIKWVVAFKLGTHCTSNTGICPFVTKVKFHNLNIWHYTRCS